MIEILEVLVNVFKIILTLCGIGIFLMVLISIIECIVEHCKEKLFKKEIHSNIKDMEKFLKEMHFVKLPDDDDNDE